MAILNYVNNLTPVENYIGLTSSSNNSNYFKLVFTGDGHIITHGHDYTADYNNGKRGLVPNYEIENYNYGVFTKSGWQKLTSEYLPIDDNNINTTHLWSSDKISKFVEATFADKLKANDAMQFKGVLDSESDGQTEGILKDLPIKDYEAGFTYRVAKAGTYAGILCEEGDIIIAVKDGSASNTTVVNSDWSVIQTNIKGKGKFTLNKNIEVDFYTDNSLDKDLTFYMPTTGGTANQVLISKGDAAPEWANQNTLNAGQLGGRSLTELIDEVTANNGTISVKVGGTEKTATANGNWNINAASANKVNNSLKTSGSGLSSVTYDGSAEQTITLQPATRDTLGGVMIDKNKTNKTISIDEDGNIYLEKENVINALGFTPETVENTVIVSDKHKGVAPQITKSGNIVNESFYFLAYNPAGTETSENGIEANWYKLPTNVLGNTWRPVSINGTQLFDNSNTDENVLEFVNNNFIHVSKTNSNKIEFTPNYSVFTGIKLGDKTVSAEGITDTLTLTGDNISITDIGGSTERKIQFSVAKYAGIGSTGLIHSAENTDATAFMQADGTWTKNTYREIKVGTSTLSSDNTSGALTITAGKDIAVTLVNGTLNIASTYVDHIYSVGTGLNSASINEGKETKFSLKTATADEIGGVKIGYTTNNTNRKYAVQLDENEKAYVNVPWTDTNIRDIQINGESIGTKTLNIVPSEDVILHWDKGAAADDSDGAATISFGLSWYNMSTESYETA